MSLVNVTRQPFSMGEKVMSLSRPETLMPPMVKVTVPWFAACAFICDACEAKPESSSVTSATNVHSCPCHRYAPSSGSTSTTTGGALSTTTVAEVEARTPGGGG